MRGGGCGCGGGGGEEVGDYEGGRAGFAPYAAVQRGPDISRGFGWKRVGESGSRIRDVGTKGIRENQKGEPLAGFRGRHDAIRDEACEVVGCFLVRRLVREKRQLDWVLQVQKATQSPL